jgi:hypothetical protein
MQSNPHQFNKYRRQNNPFGGVINTTVSEIMRYVIDCYLVMLEEKPNYSISKTKEETTYKFEEYLTSRLVEDYLTTRLTFFSHSQLSQIQFITEANRGYIDIRDQKEKPDKIDIYITNLHLDKELCTNSQPYFAIECKRIYKSSSADEYISDIQKFAERKHTQTRLPFEGQLAYIENPKYPHSVSKENINSKLAKHEYINTTQFLEYKQFHERFDASYSSKHIRNFGEKKVFTIYHLLFNYTQIVVD